MNKKTMSGIIISTIAFIAAFSFHTAHASTPIHLRIETPTETLFNSDLEVEPCQATSTASLATSSLCAVNQTGLPVEWTWYNIGAFLNSIGAYANDWTNNTSWSVFYGDAIATESFDAHILAPHERVLLAYGLVPLKTSLSSSTIDAFGTTTISVEYPDMWTLAWAPEASSTLHINDLAFDIASSSFEFSTSTPGTYSMWVSKVGRLNSEPLTLTVLPQQEATSTSTTTQETSTGTSTSSTTPNTETQPAQTSGGGVSTWSPQPTPAFNVDAALNFLVSHQQEDGSFGAALYTDWAALALAPSNHIAAKQKLSAYLISHPETSSLVTDAERRAMALMALGVNPYNGTSVNYIKKITDSFDGTQIGDPSLFNDDIFALFPLLKSGYTASDPVVVQTVAFIISKQSPEGRWIGVDLTAAAVQALSQVKSLPGVSDALVRAKQYLKSNELYGGFSTSFSTSWTLQAIRALDETPAQWTQGTTTPLTYLSSLQGSDGSVESFSTLENRMWATAYAIPAALQKPWPELLASFPRAYEAPAQNQPSTSPLTSPAAVAQTASASTTASSTQAIQTSTSSPKTPRTFLPIIETENTESSVKDEADTTPEIQNSTSTEATTTESPVPQATSSASTSADLASAYESSPKPSYLLQIAAILLGLAGISFFIFRNKG